LNDYHILVKNKTPNDYLTDIFYILRNNQQKYKISLRCAPIASQVAVS